MGKEYCTKRPCSECPFSRTYPIEEKEGFVDPLRLVGQGHHSFWLPCHMDPEYKGAGHVDVKLAQCAGAGIYRANIGISEHEPDYLHRLGYDLESVFGSPEELLAHHARIPIEEAKRLLEETTPLDLTIRELLRAGADRVMLSESGARAGQGREIQNASLQQIGMARMLKAALEAKEAGATVFPPEKLKGEL